MKLTLFDHFLIQNQILKLTAYPQYPLCRQSSFQDVSQCSGCNALTMISEEKAEEYLSFSHD